jgi:hypothetical protein
MSSNSKSRKISAFNLDDSFISCPYMKYLKNKSSNPSIKYTDAVAEHISYFSELNGKITEKSMKDGHNKQHIFNNVGIKIIAILNLLYKYSFEPIISSLLKVNNPASTGLWDSDGNFDENQFKKLYDKRIIDSVNNKEIITKQMFNELRQEKYLSDNAKTYNNIAVWVYWILPISWSQITDGSINELFEYYSDATYNNEKVLTVGRVFDFYTKPKEVMMAKENEFIE